MINGVINKVLPNPKACHTIVYHLLNQYLVFLCQFLHLDQYLNLLNTMLVAIILFQVTPFVLI